VRRNNLRIERIAYEEWNDEELASDAKRGDREARNTLFLRHMERFQQLAIPAKRIVASQSQRDRSIDTGDVDQQLFIIFCDLLASWQKERTPFIPYVISNIGWRALHYVREVTRYRSKAVLEREDTQERNEAGMMLEDGDNAHVEVESRVDWAAQTAQLKPSWKRLVALRFAEGMSSGCSRRTVNRELRAAMQLILQKLQEDWEECA
jgi:hypothetical protein